MAKYHIIYSDTNGKSDERVLWTNDKISPRDYFFIMLDTNSDKLVYTKNMTMPKDHLSVIRIHFITELV